MRLEVAKIDEADVYKDTARVPEKHRLDKNKPIPEGRICKVTTGKRSILLSLRGKEDHSNPAIHLDGKTRTALRVTVGEQATFHFRQVSWMGQFLWAWRATDPAYRIAARVGLLSVILGIVGLVLGAIGLWTALAQRGC